MSLRDLTREAVHRAIGECDRLGREPFLVRYGFRPARDYELIDKGEHYDSKAIAGVAHQYIHLHAKPLAPSEFSGGMCRGCAALRLSELGFEIKRISK